MQIDYYRGTQNVHELFQLQMTLCHELMLAHGAGPVDQADLDQLRSAERDLHTDNYIDE